MKGYTLIITEKPGAAARIAEALDFEGTPRKSKTGGVPVYLARRDREIIIVPALGHLYTVGSPEKTSGSYPIFKYSWVPIHKVERKRKKIRAWITTISKLAANADSFIDACDFDIEGNVIGYNILKFACKGKENSAKRMKYSTLTKNEIEQAFLEPQPTLDFCSIESGLARHEVDWLYGINLSRALTAAARKFSTRCAFLSTGRVQGPTLKFIAMREKSIRSYVPTPYWTLETLLSVDGSIVEVDYEKTRIEKKEEAERIVRSCSGKMGRIERIEKTEWKLSPPTPFDLSELQNEAYRVFKYSPMQTSRISQRLYLDGLISYPRTSSQKLPSTIGHRAILRQLLESSEHKDNAANLLATKELKPKEGRGIDPAHPAIFPTGNLPKKVYSKHEGNIWNLVVRRYMSSFGANAIFRSTKAAISIEGYAFMAKVKETTERGWTRYYEPYTKTENRYLPIMNENEFVKVKRMIAKEKSTLPPPRYNPSTIIKKMQTEEIGTKATRAGIVQTLYDRKYIREETISITDIGLEVLDVLMKNCPNAASPRLTRNLEEKMALIQRGKATREEVVEEAIETLKPILEKLKAEEQRIGKQLNQSLIKSWADDKTIGKCPVCGKGELVIIRSKKTKKKFLGCTKYFEGTCKASFPLPQRGSIQPLIVCSDCGWQRIEAKNKGKNFWNFCLNPQCPSRIGMAANEMQSL